MNILLTDTTITLQNFTEGDLELLYVIYSSTRTEELKQVVNWSDEQKELFLRQQFHAQHTYYQQQFSGADFMILKKDNEPIGRLYLNKKDENNKVHIIDIALLPDWRNKGIGKQLLLDILHFAEMHERDVTIHVETFNPAMRLYKRLGFQFKEDTNGIYHLMEWHLNKQAVA